MGDREARADFPNADQRFAFCSSVYERARQARQFWFTGRSAAPARRETFLGRSFVVVPAVLVRSQVLRNNLGAAFLPAEEITDEWAEAWNGIPVLVGDHPRRGGEPISGRSPELWDARGAGWIFNARAEDEGSGGRRLAAEVWLDESRAETVPGLRAVLERVSAGQTVELSTGFATHVEHQTGTHEGEVFELVMRPAGADHLVISTGDFTGACAVSDGCGLGANKEGGLVAETGENALAQARRPTFSGTETTAWSAPTLEDFVAGLDLGDVSTIDDLTAAQRARIAAHSLLGEPAAGTFADLVFFPVVNPRTGRLNARALRAVLSGRGAQANIPASARDSARRMARRLLTEEYGAEQSEGGLKGLIRRIGEVFGARQEERETAFEENAAQCLARELTAWNSMHPSDQERMGILRDALQAKFGAPDRQVVVADVFSDSQEVVFFYSTPIGPHPPGAEYFMSAYTFNADTGATSFAEPKRVRRMIKYEPVGITTGQQTADSAGVAAAANAGPSNKGDDMAGTQEHDQELKALVTQLAAQMQTMAGDIAALKAAAERDPNPAIAGLKQTIAALSEEVRAVKELAGPAIGERERERQALVRELAGNVNVPYTVPELEAKPVEELKKIQQMAAGANYTGRAPAGGNRTEEPRFVRPTNYWEVEDPKGKEAR